MDGRLEQELSRAQELRRALVEEAERMEKNLLDYRRRVRLINPDDDDAEFAAQAAYRERRAERMDHE
ncbi:MAG TPA: hypothetical protein VIL85_11865 [Thermomicrobiales bacterium]|jgi:hypothetical protein